MSLAFVLSIKATQIRELVYDARGAYISFNVAEIIKPQISISSFLSNEKPIVLFEIY
jgi:hypothetical protein